MRNKTQTKEKKKSTKLSIHLLCSKKQTQSLVPLIIHPLIGIQLVFTFHQLVYFASDIRF